jgi:hypothetical protein
MAKDGSGNEKRLEAVMPKDAPPNGDAPTDDDPADDGWVGPRRRVSEMQAKLHRWAAADPGRRFDDLFNLVHDPATLIVAWDRVATNRGANTAGSDWSRVSPIARVRVAAFRFASVRFALVRFARTRRAGHRHPARLRVPVRWGDGRR